MMNDHLCFSRKISMGATDWTVSVFGGMHNSDDLWTSVQIVTGGPTTISRFIAGTGSQHAHL